MLKYAADSQAVHQVIAVTSPENRASIRVLEKAQMKKKKDGLREDGRVCYEIVFEKTRAKELSTES